MPSSMIREVVNKCFETGMNDRIAKPVEFDRLEYVLTKWLPEK
jgi:response regulator of citrate/malate metabolism